ncbi:MAG TPA: polysaccharide lyase family 8 super-sandwich domain-containing protein [Flavitalea sp.]|nr:polysaccharide lyase family 8 super-sandwich domain-containing protein [Flavitalea sp.]
MNTTIRTNINLLLSVILLSISIAASGNAKEQNKIRISEAANKADADIETIRARIINDLLKPNDSKTKVAELIKTLKDDGTWPGINYVDVSRTGFEHRIHLENMLTLSRAIKKKGSPSFNDPVAKRTLSTALDYWLKNDFRCDNWWWNEMGTPQLMINILLLMDTDLTERQKTEGLKIAGRANLEAFGARPGGDLLPIAGMLGKQALFMRNGELFERVIKAMSSEIKITTGRGIKPDLSFHHRTDNVISTLTYGTNFANSFAYWAVKIAGTKYNLPQDAIKLLIDYFLDGICKSMVYGIYPDPGAQNRDMTRMNALEAEGTELPENLRKSSGYRAKELEEIIKLRRGLARPSLVFNRFFWHSSYLVHQRANYFASVRMHSTRGNNMEEPHNEEGLKNHHFGDGSNFISRRGNEYYNIYPVWDWQKIPGTTVLQNKDVPGWKELAKKGLSEFSGGATNGRYGAVAIDLISVHDPLRAKKAWFFFDKEYVCLGAGISTGSDLPVYTTLNQCLLKNDVLVSDGSGKSILKKGDHHLDNVSWVLHDSVGYLFPSPVTLEMINREVAGNWRQINHQAWATTDPVKKNVFSLWLDHGKKTQNGTYEYVVVPATGAKGLDDYLKNAGIRVLSNSGSLQAVTNMKLNITQLVFYEAGSVTVDGLGISAEQPCIVVINGNKNGVKQITVSDPTEKLEKIVLRVNVKFSKGEWDEVKKESRIEVTLPQGGMAGSSVVL